MSEIKNGRLDLRGDEHSKCNRMTTRGFKWLMQMSGDPVCCSDLKESSCAYLMTDLVRAAFTNHVKDVGMTRRLRLMSTSETAGTTTSEPTRRTAIWTGMADIYNR